MSKNISFNLTTSTTITKIKTHSQNKTLKNSKNQTQRYAKKIKEYMISFCSGQLLGRSLYGEKSKVVAFRINSQPLSISAKKNLEFQEKMAKIKDCACQIEEVFDRKRNRYTGYEYFPKTFKTELQNFQKSAKVLSQCLEKFFITYAKLYYLRIIHGNLSLTNIGITFDGKVKLMDFRQSEENFEEGVKKDYLAFRDMMCTIMLRDRIFPQKLECLDEADRSWQKLFSQWHIVHPYQYIYVRKKNSYQNIVVLLKKLQASILEYITENSQSFTIALRCLNLQFLYKMSKTNKKRALPEIKKLRNILAPVFCGQRAQKQNLISYFNSLLWGILCDPEHFGLTFTHKLALIACFLEGVNHQYLFVEIFKQFEEIRVYSRIKGKMEKQLQIEQVEAIRNMEMHKILANNLFANHYEQIKKQLLDINTIHEIDELFFAPRSVSSVDTSLLSINQSINSQKMKFKRSQNAIQKNIRLEFLKNINSKKSSIQKSLSIPIYGSFLKKNLLNQSQNTQEGNIKQ